MESPRYIDIMLLKFPIFSVKIQTTKKKRNHDRKGLIYQAAPRQLFDRQTVLLNVVVIKNFIWPPAKSQFRRIFETRLLHSVLRYSR